LHKLKNKLGQTDTYVKDQINSEIKLKNTETILRYCITGTSYMNYCSDLIVKLCICKLKISGKCAKNRRLR
jgi:hypothetical protein